MGEFGETVLDAMLLTNAGEDVVACVVLKRYAAKLRIVVSQRFSTLQGSAASTRRRNSAASIWVARGCNSAKATLPVRSMATNR